MILRRLCKLKHQNILHRCNRIWAEHHKLIYPFCTSMNKNVDTTVRGVIEYWSRRFKNENIPEPVESIQYIMSHIMNVSKCLELTYLYNKRLSEMQLKTLETLCLCRLSRMPVQYIIGEWTFRDITVKLIPPIFIPRSETEILVDFVAKQILMKKNVEGRAMNILEIGCGSGVISLAILNLCKNKANVKCIAIDQNPDACELAKSNAQLLGFDSNHIDIINATIEDNGKITTTAEGLNIDFSNKQFDVIVSNPPYIPTKEISGLPSEIKIFEDIKALDGGPDGLRIIKAIIKYASIGLKPSGHLFMEVDSSHPQSIQFFVSKFDNMKLEYSHTYKDYCNNDRFVEICKIDQVLY